MFEQLIIFMGLKKNIFFYETALHDACYKGRTDVVKYLISLDNIKINVKDIFLYVLIKFQKK